MSTPDFSVLVNDAEQVAPRLLGCELVGDIGGQRIVARIVETEAYNQYDAASHSYRGQTPRTEVMFGPAGYTYVYFTYGMHYCLNVVTGPTGHGSAVLIRALEPIAGLEFMQANRPKVTVERELTNGPAKLCQALAIDKVLNGHNLHNAPLQLVIKPPLASSEIVISTRVGISRDMHRLWRFFVMDNAYVSKAT